jgi:hypothetical protein
MVLLAVKIMSKYTTTINEYLNSELSRMGLNETVNDGKLTFFDDEFQFIQKILKYDDDVHNIVTNKIFKGYKLPNNEVDKFFKKSFITRFLDREIGRQTIDAFSSQVLYVTLSHQEYIQTVFGSEYQKYFEQHVDYNTDTVGNTIEQSTEHGETKQTQESNTKDTHTDTSNETHSDTSTTTGQTTTDDRSAESTLPQSEVNINVNNDELSYADTNNISKNKGTSSTDVNSSGQSENHSNGNRNSDFNGVTDGLSDSECNAQSDNTSNTQSLTKTYLLDNLKAIYDMKDQLYNTYDKKCFLHIW